MTISKKLKISAVLIFLSACTSTTSLSNTSNLELCSAFFIIKGHGQWAIEDGEEVFVSYDTDKTLRQIHIHNEIYRLKCGDFKKGL